jgi:hypothetical protein
MFSIKASGRVKTKFVNRCSSRLFLTSGCLEESHVGSLNEARLLSSRKLLPQSKRTTAALGNMSAALCFVRKVISKNEPQFINLASHHPTVTVTSACSPRCFIAVVIISLFVSFVLSLSLLVYVLLTSLQVTLLMYFLVVIN